LEHPLRRFFEPRSVAVIGASATPHKPGNDVVKNILANKYTGKLYLVNPKGEEILGIRAHKSVAELPDGIDLAIVILPAQSNPEAVRQCAAKGIKAIVLAAGGFSEVDEAGRALQEELVRAIKETGVRVIGPKHIGDTRQRPSISPPASFLWVPYPKAGSPTWPRQGTSPLTRCATS
jgi:acyl-CoA synthetase (NDP forming)